MTEKLTPYEYHVLVLPDPIEDTITAPGGTKFLMAETSEEANRRKAKQEKATIIKFASNAFEGWPVKPSIGDRIYMPQYAGDIIIGDDGVKYRLIMDKEIKLGRTS